MGASRTSPPSSLWLCYIFGESEGNFWSKSGHWGNFGSRNLSKTRYFHPKISGALRAPETLQKPMVLTSKFRNFCVLSRNEKMQFNQWFLNIPAPGLTFWKWNIRNGRGPDLPPPSTLCLCSLFGQSEKGT